MCLLIFFFCVVSNVANRRYDPSYPLDRSDPTFPDAYVAAISARTVGVERGALYDSFVAGHPGATGILNRHAPSASIDDEDAAGDHNNRKRGSRSKKSSGSSGSWSGGGRAAFQAVHKPAIISLRFCHIICLCLVALGLFI